MRVYHTCSNSLDKVKNCKDFLLLVTGPSWSSTALERTSTTKVSRFIFIHVIPPNNTFNVLQRVRSKTSCKVQFSYLVESIISLICKLWIQMKILYKERP